LYTSDSYLVSPSLVFRRVSTVRPLYVYDVERYDQILGAIDSVATETVRNRRGEG